MTQVHFDSLSEVIDHVSALPKVGEDDREFSLPTFEYAKDLATFGWKEGAQRVGELATRIANRVVANPGFSTVIGYEYDVTGVAFDMGAVMAGVPEAWLNFVPQPVKREVKILVNLAASQVVPNSVIQERGFAVAALALSLQSCGYAVTVDVSQQSKHERYGVLITTVRVADASTGSVLDLDRLAYATAHPTMYRRVMFAVRGNQRGQYNADRVGNAAPYDVALDGYQVYIGGAHLKQAERWTDGGEAWVIEEFKRQTGEGA